MKCNIGSRPDGGVSFVNGFAHNKIDEDNVVWNMVRGYDGSMKLWLIGMTPLLATLLLPVTARNSGNLLQPSFYDMCARL